MASVTPMLAEYLRLETRIRASLRGEPGNFGILALALHQFQRRWNAPYAAFCATLPEPRDWRGIPAVPQSAFKEFDLSVAPLNDRKIFYTSGTTGEGRGRHTMVNVALYEAAVRAGWARLQLPRWPHFALVPHPHVAPYSSLAHMIWALDSLSFGTRWLLDAEGAFDPTMLCALEETAGRGEPVALLGTALAFLNLFEHLNGRRLALPAGSYAMETGGFKGSGREIAKDELYAQFGDFLDLAPDAVLNEYGMTELTSQFYSRGSSGTHSGPPWLRAVVFHPETGAEVSVGETGVLRIFDLANLSSVLAIETQDLAIRREDGFELLGRDPGALPRGCSRAADELLQRR